MPTTQPANGWGFNPQTVFTILLALFGAWIAYRQYRTAHAKLKLDLYDRRYKFYSRLRDFFMKAIASGAVSRDDLASFQLHAQEASFLFDGLIVLFIKDVETRGHKLWYVSEKLRAYADTGGAPHEDLTESGELLEWFNMNIDRLEFFFHPFLSLGDLQ